VEPEPEPEPKLESEQQQLEVEELQQCPSCSRDLCSILLATKSKRSKQSMLVSDISCYYRFKQDSETEKQNEGGRERIVRNRMPVSLKVGGGELGNLKS
jgi:hypothetical protein